MREDSTKSFNKRVCILTSAHPSMDIRIFYKEAQSLYKAGYEVILIAQHKCEETVDGIHIIPLPTPRNRPERMLKNPWILMRLALKQKAGIYHIHDPELIPIVLLLRIITGAKIIYDVHEDYSKALLSRDWLPQGLRSIIASLFGFLENLSIYFFHATVSATPGIAQKFKQSRCRSITVQNYPISRELLDYDSGVSWEERPNTVFYLGAIDYLRGLKEMVQAVLHASHKVDVRLVIAGTFSSASMLKDLNKEMKKGPIEYIGFLSRPQVVSFFKKVKIGLVLFHPEPNHIFSQPNKLFEYMSAGIPVVVSDFPLWREIVEGVGCGLLVDPLKPEMIAEAIVSLINNPEQASEMGHKGRKAVLEKYNWEREEIKLLQLYDMLTSG